MDDHLEGGELVVRQTMLQALSHPLQRGEKDAHSEGDGLAAQLRKLQGFGHPQSNSQEPGTRTSKQ
jgi:hypothetical protein